jgi:peptidoglycan/xylan/chitin deacetylase (PgdA/CDA1 family)
VALAALGLAVALVAAAAIVLAGEVGDGGSDRRSGGGSATSGGGAGGTGSKPLANGRSQPDWVPHTGPVPIIEYHVLGAAPPAAPYPELYVARPDFRRQMDWLDRQGYEAVTLDQAQDAWYRGGTLPPKPVVIAFDDGYRPQFTFALPELRRHGWAGVLNLKAEGSDLYPSNVEAMIAAGWELASHTISHPDLTTVDAGTLRKEVAGSRAILRRTYGVPVNNFCYPSGRYDPTVVAAVEAAGYAGATTQVPGFADRDRPYELKRLEILGSSGVAGLASALAAGRPRKSSGLNQQEGRGFRPLDLAQRRTAMPSASMRRFASSIVKVP